MAENSKEKPIPMTGEMVRATLEGRKTQTRRIVDFRKIAKQTGCTSGKLAWSTAFNSWAVFGGNGDADLDLVDAPYQVGMKLWVRETFALENTYEYHGDHEIPTDGRPVQKHESEDWGYWLIPRYRATEPDTLLLIKETEHPEDAMRWTPSIHMPRWASRITLEITNVRVERVRDISLADVFAEGCCLSTDKANLNDFQNLWISIYGPDSWNTNPFVWVLEFRQFPLSKAGEG